MILARSRAAGRSALTVGCASRANGRTWSRIGGVVSREVLGPRCACRAAARPAAASRSVGPSICRRRPRTASAEFVVFERAGQQLERLAQVARPGWRTPRTPRSATTTSSASSLSFVPTSVTSSWRLWISRARLLAPLREHPRELRDVAVQRLEAAAALRKRGPLSFEALATAGHQQPQVVARVAVEVGENLVEVHVGSCLRDRDRVALGDLPAPRACPGRPRSSCP